jgi:hypothetical protein
MTEILESIDKIRNTLNLLTQQLNAIEFDLKLSLYRKHIKEIIITEALWHDKNVTSEVQKLIEIHGVIKGPLFETLGNPAPEIKKILKITYMINGSLKRFQWIENGFYSQYLEFP